MISLHRDSCLCGKRRYIFNIQAVGEKGTENWFQPNMEYRESLDEAFFHFAFFHVIIMIVLHVTGKDDDVER